MSSEYWIEGRIGESCERRVITYIGISKHLETEPGRQIFFQIPGKRRGGVKVKKISEACCQGFSTGTAVSSPPSSIGGSANNIKLNKWDFNSFKLNS